MYVCRAGGLIHFPLQFVYWPVEKYSWMKSFNPAAVEEERAAMVPPPPAARDEIVDDPPAELQPSSSPAAKPCWKTTTSSGTGVVIGTLVFLALLVGTNWIHHEAGVSVPPFFFSEYSVPPTYTHIHCMNA